MKKENGITLIALVITIIVLLILAGVTVATLTGDNGILTKASDAKKVDEIASTLEKIQVEVAGSYGLDGKIDLTELNKNLQNIDGLIYNNEKIDLNDENNKIERLPAIVKLNKEYFKIFDNGKVILMQTIESLTKDNYGDYIDLGQSVVGTDETTDDWKILYNDKSKYVYAILADYLPNTNPAVTASGLVKNYTHVISNTSQSRKDLVDALNSETAWQSLVSDNLNNKGVKVKGATTADIIMESYNEKYGTNLNYTSSPYLLINPNDTSSFIDSLYVPHPGNSNYGGCKRYWLASYADGGMVYSVTYNAKLEKLYCNGHDAGICPVVLLPFDFYVGKTVSNGVTIWTLDTKN